MTESKGTTQPKSAPLPVGTLLSNYRIVKKLASGGFSFVYLATDETGAPVAIKEYLPSSLARRNPGELIPVRRIAGDPNPFVGSFTIDKGEDEGVQVGMTVATARGLVGRVIRSSPASAGCRRASTTA